MPRMGSVSVATVHSGYLIEDGHLFSILILCLLNGWAGGKHPSVPPAHPFRWFCTRAAIPCRGWAVFLVHGGYLIEDGQKQDREWNTNYLDLQFVIHMSDFYDQLADGR